MWCKAKVCCPHRGKKEREPDDASELMHEVQSERYRRRGRGNKRLGDFGVRSTMCAKIIWDSSYSKRFSLPRRAGKCIAITSFTNESKIEVPDRNYRCVNLHNTLHSDCSWQLCNYWFVLLTLWIGCWIWLLTTVGYMRSDILKFICTSKIGLQVLHDGVLNTCKYGP